jgi:hypothetical protein
MYDTAKPFRFEDLNGKPEPASWGPVYPKTASASVEKWRMLARGRELSSDEKRAYGQAVGAWIRALNAPKRAPNTLGETTNAPSGQTGEFCSVKHRAKIRAAFAAQAGRDRLEWALGKSKNCQGLTIKQAYALAMKAKRARLEAQPMREAA